MCFRAKSLATVVKTLSSLSELGLGRKETVQKKAVKAIVYGAEAQIRNLRSMYEQVLGKCRFFDADVATVE